jgi:hypothetical protein
MRKDRIREGMRYKNEEGRRMCSTTLLPHTRFESDAIKRYIHIINTKYILVVQKKVLRG